MIKKKIREKIEEGIYLELRGSSHMLLEGVDRLLVYEDDIISITGCGRIIIIKGKNLTLDYLADKKIAIKGFIKSFEYGGSANNDV